MEEEKENIEDLWYTEKMAATTTDPIILRKILEKGNDDKISLEAIDNKNCPNVG